MRLAVEDSYASHEYEAPPQTSPTSPFLNIPDGFSESALSYRHKRNIELRHRELCVFPAGARSLSLSRPESWQRAGSLESESIKLPGLRLRIVYYNLAR